jgi:hypothetical protein
MFVNFDENLINLDYIKKNKTTTKNILQKNLVNIDLSFSEIINNCYEDFFFRKKTTKANAI